MHHSDPPPYCKRHVGGLKTLISGRECDPYRSLQIGKPVRPGRLLWLTALGHAERFLAGSGAFVMPEAHGICAQFTSACDEMARQML